MFKLRSLDAWLADVHQAGLPRGSSFRPSISTPSPPMPREEPLEETPCPRGAAASQKGILTFLARDATGAAFLCYAHAGIPKAEQADEILRFVAFWHQQTGALPAELVFDSQLTTYANLNRLNQRGIRFLTRRRRSRQNAGTDREPPGLGLATHHLAGVGHGRFAPRVSWMNGSACATMKARCGRSRSSIWDTSNPRSC